MKPKASESEVFDFLTFVSVNDIDKNILLSAKTQKGINIPPEAL